jgi:hypothetical protein
MGPTVEQGDIEQQLFKSSPMSYRTRPLRAKLQFSKEKAADHKKSTAFKHLNLVIVSR